MDASSRKVPGMIGLVIAGVALGIGGLSVARGVQRRKESQGAPSVDARTQMTKLQLVTLLATQVRAAVREAAACRKTADYEACLNGRPRRLMRAAGGTAAMVGGMPVFTAALNAMGAGADDDFVMGKVVKSGEVWPGTTTPILKYIETSLR